MSRGRRSRRRRSEGTLETGLGLAALGIFLLMLPVFMNSPLQQSALEPLEPMGWFLLLAGVAVCAWCFRPIDAAGRAASETLSWLSRSGNRRPSGVTPDRKARGKIVSRRTAKRERTEPADDAERRAALKAAVKANVARMALPTSGFNEEASSQQVTSKSDSGFADTVLSMLGAQRIPHDEALPPVDSQALREAPPTSWNGRVFQLIEWRRFEAVVEALFEQAGFRTLPQKHDAAEGADGGVDIWLYSRHAKRAVSVVQCKHWQGRPVTVGDVSRFFGVMTSHKLKRGTYATSSTFTPDALAFAAEHGINAMDGSALLELIHMRTPEQQAALLDIAFNGEDWRPTCSTCGVKLVQRGSAENGSLFWGCSNFPECKNRMPVAA
jgi:restriction system protein